MKLSTYLTMSISLLAFTSNAQNNFSIQGKFSSLKEDRKVFLQYQIKGKQVEDSTLTNKGIFSFKGQVPDMPIKAVLTLQPLQEDPTMPFLEKILKRDVQEFFIEKGLTLIQGTHTAKGAFISGGKTQKENLLLQASVKGELDKMRPLSEKMIPILIKAQGKGIDTNLQVIAIQKEMIPIRKTITQKEEAFILAHPDSYVSFDLVQERGIIIQPKVFEPLFNSLSVRLKNTAEGKALAQQLKATKTTAIGVVANDFSQPDINGKLISLHSYRGKYVLLDFWASWCGPCRAENPNVLKAYHSFKDKNFDVLAVSLDEKKENWLKAVKEDGLPWVQVSDLLGYKNQAAELYAISAIPQNFLIDPNGVIIARDLRGEELLKKLGELIK